MFEGTRVLIVKVNRRFGAPPAVVFSVIHDDDLFFVLRPGAVEHRDIVVEPTGGYSCTQVYEMNGQRISQRNRNVEYVAGKRVVDEVEAETGARTRSTMTFEPQGDGALVRVRREAVGSRRPGLLARRRYAKGVRNSLNGFFVRVEEVISQQSRS